ncbi:hypothetical protein C8F01DRAFT_1179889 [Mycena amicta]|nr:hypothetical protein C8F01DRAFT_1179889 [Mycena amicta]
MYRNGRHGPGRPVLRHSTCPSSASIFECRFSIDSDTGPDTGQPNASAPALIGSSNNHWLPGIVVSRCRFDHSESYAQNMYPQWPANYIILLDPFLTVHHRPTQYVPVLVAHCKVVSVVSRISHMGYTASTSSVVTERRGSVGRCLQMLGRARTQHCSSMVRKNRTTTRDPFACSPSAIRLPPWPFASTTAREIIPRNQEHASSLLFPSIFTTHIPSLTTPFLSMVTTTTVLGTPRAFSTTSPPSG